MNYIIYGLPRSGTNYLNSLLKENNRCMNRNHIGHETWKHNLPKKFPGCVTLITFRPLGEWVCSAYKYRQETPSWLRTNFGVDFCSIESLCEFYSRYLNDAWDKGHIVSLRGLREDPAKEIAQIKELGLEVGGPHNRRVLSSGKVARGEIRIEKWEEGEYLNTLGTEELKTLAQYMDNRLEQVDKTRFKLLKSVEDFLEYDIKHPEGFNCLRRISGSHY